MLETDLCNEFIKLAENYGFQSQPEFEGWDFVLKKNNIIVGIQAKLQFNAHVIAQCLHNNNVHFKIILLPNLPRLDADLELIAHRLGIIIVTLDALGSPTARSMSKSVFYYRQKIDRLLRFPAEKFDLQAGVKSPKTLSDYKISLCKLEILAEKNGYLVPFDFRSLGIKIIPKYYFRFDYNRRKWFLKHLPSTDYPHIYRNLKNANI